jgi:hypothetical protein
MMATLEELMAEDGYLPQGIEVNATTRSVTVPASVGTVAIAQDKNVRTLAIKVPRECFGVDLAPYDFTVNYKRGDGIEGSQPVDVSEDEGHLDVLWKVCPHAVQEPGTVQFQLCATEHAADGLTVVNEWHSGIAEFDVGDVLEHSDVFEDETYLDWAHKVIADCEAATASAHEAVGMIDSKLEEACAAAEEEIAAAEEERAIAELGRAEAEALRAAQFADMEQRSRGWLRYICQPGEFDPDTRQPIISEPHAGTMYFVPSAIPTEQSMYQEWIWVSGDERWESFGEVELSITPASPDQLVAVLDGTDGGEGGGEVVNLTGWRSVVPRLKAMFAGIVHKHSGADLTDGTVTAAKLASGAVTQAKIADGSVSLAKCDSTLRDSVSQSNVVLPNAANSTHRIEQVRMVRDGHTVHVSGLLTCVYAQIDGYSQLIASTTLPAPSAGIVYCDTPAGHLAIEEGRIRVHGGTVGTSYRFHDSYAV